MDAGPGLRVIGQNARPPASEQFGNRVVTVGKIGRSQHGEVMRHARRAVVNQVPERNRCRILRRRVGPQKRADRATSVRLEEVSGGRFWCP